MAEESINIRGKSILMCPCPPKIPYELAWDKSQASAMKTCQGAA
jgi:hypothetical protein